MTFSNMTTPPQGLPGYDYDERVGEIKKSHVIVLYSLQPAIGSSDRFGEIQSG